MTYDIESRLTNFHNACLVLSHRQEPFGTQLTGSQMKMRELGNGISDRVVNSTAVIPSGHMHNRDIQMSRSNGTCQHFTTISLQQHDVGFNSFHYRRNPNER